MKPIFSPINSVIDVARLRLAADTDIGDLKNDLIATAKSAIQSWEGRLEVSITNINLLHEAASSDYVIRVGMGASAPEPNKTLKVSYVGPADGYFFVDKIGEIEKLNAGVVAHEFGHLLGLADRYYEGYLYSTAVAAIYKEGERAAVPMASKLFPKEPDYIPASNIMSSNQSVVDSWTISSVQRDLILTGKEESQLTRSVVALFDSTKTTGPSARPAAMYLDGDHFYRDPAVGDKADTPVRIAGYELIGKVLMPKAQHTELGNDPVDELWQRRSRKDATGAPAIKIVRDGVLFRGRRRRTAANGPRIHEKKMSLIGNLTGK